MSELGFTKRLIPKWKSYEMIGAHSRLTEQLIYLHLFQPETCKAKG